MLSVGLTACSKENNKKANNTTSTKQAVSSGRFITVDSKTIYGEPITNSVYKENELTLVNIMEVCTW